jgi:hypothetical protein
MSRHARKSFLGGCAVAPDLGKTDESNSGAFGLITGGEERFELYRHTIGELRERPADHVSLIGDEQPPSSRRCGCRPTVRFWSSGAPSASARCPRGRARPGVTERRVTGSTTPPSRSTKWRRRPSLRWGGRRSRVREHSARIAAAASRRPALLSRLVDRLARASRQATHHRGRFGEPYVSSRQSREQRSVGDRPNRGEPVQGPPSHLPTHD